MTVLAISISPARNRVIRAGYSVVTYKCYWNNTQQEWHYYPLSPDPQPCGFSRNLYTGVPLCPSVPRISVDYSSGRRGNMTKLSIRRARLSDAGTYTCGDRNPNNRNTTQSVYIGVVGRYTTYHREFAEEALRK